MPIAAHIRMCHVVEQDWLEVLHADYFTYTSRIDSLLESNKIGSIAQYMAYSHNAVVLFSCSKNVGTFLDRKSVV